MTPPAALATEVLKYATSWASLGADFQFTGTLARYYVKLDP